MNRIEALCLVFGDNCNLATSDTVAMIGNSLALSDDEFEKLPDNIFRMIESFQSDPQQFIDSFEEEAYRELLRGLALNISANEQGAETVDTKGREDGKKALDPHIAQLVAAFKFGIIICAMHLEHDKVIKHPRWQLLYPLVLEEIEACKSLDGKSKELAEEKLKARKDQLYAYADAKMSSLELCAVGKYMLLIFKLFEIGHMFEYEFDPSSPMFRHLFVDPKTVLPDNPLEF